MPLSAAVPRQSKKKALEGASKKKKKRVQGGPDAVAVPPGKKIERKSEKGSRKVSSSAVSGKVAEIINPLVLFYWNGRGLMEAPRMMLGWHKPNIQVFLDFNTYFAALSGKFPGDDFIDTRHSHPPLGNVLDANLGRFPVIQTSQGVAIGQSRAINFYVANICDMLGDNPTETALVLSFSEHLQARFSVFVSVSALSHLNLHLTRRCKRRGLVLCPLAMFRPRNTSKHFLRNRIRVT